MFWILCAAAVLVQDDRLPLPDPSALKEAERVVRDVFKEDYAHPGLAERRAFARKLLQMARSPDNDAPTRYVLLRDAQSFGDLETGLGAAVECARLFRVDLLPLKQAVLSAALAPTPEEAKAAAEAWLALSDEFLAAGQADSADKAAQQAVALSRRAKDVPLAGRAQAKAKLVAEARARLETLRKAERVLAEKPDDPGANAEVGRYLCLTRNDWAAGLPRLAKGDVATLRDLAARDLQGAAEAVGQISLGDGWWEVGEKAAGAERANARERALRWYEKAYAGTSGLTRLKLETRFKELGRTPPAERGTLGPFELDPQGFVRNWLLVGPFPNEGGTKGRLVDYLGGEAKHVPKVGGEAPGGKAWAAYAAPGPTVTISSVPHLGLRLGQPNVLVYVACWLDVEADLEAEIRFGSDDVSTVWLDHQEFAKRPQGGGLKVDQVKAPAKLTKGRHLILAKVDNVTGGFQWTFRVVTPDGQRAPGVKVWN